MNYTHHLVKILNIKRRMIDKAIKPYGLKRLEWQVLAHLQSYPEGLAQNALLKLTDVDAAMLTRTVDKLYTKELIFRQPHPKDRRANMLSLSCNGKHIANELSIITQRFQQQLYTGMNKQQQQLLQSLTEKVSDNAINYAAEHL